MKNYYAIMAKSVSINSAYKAVTISEKTYAKCLDDDIIVWYDDGENIFIGDCSLSEMGVKKAIFDRIGEYKEQFECFH